MCYRTSVILCNANRRLYVEEAPKQKAKFAQVLLKSRWVRIRKHRLHKITDTH